MTLTLSPDDRAALAGERGEGVRVAMAIVVRMAGIAQAGELLDISAAHIDSSLYLGDATLAFAERLAALGATVSVPSTLNVSGVDEHGWRDWPVPAAFAAKARRQMDAYRAMGCLPTWTCAPYQTKHRPHFGQQIAWGESNAICFANSVIGARTERYPDLFDICAAITGRVPAAGLHLDEPRRARDLIRLRDVPARLAGDDAFFPVLGHLLGRLAGERVVVVEGMPAAPSEDQLKALCAAAASSGACALIHLVGITPEAPSLAAALGGRTPERVLDIDANALRAARRELTSGTDGPLAMVVLGSPHFSLAEFRGLAPLLAGRRKHPALEFVVTSSRVMVTLARDEGLLETLEAFGGRITVDTCILTTPMVRPGSGTIMTNSAKYAYYAPGLLSAPTAFGSTVECVESAVRGSLVRDEAPWQS